MSLNKWRTARYIRTSVLALTVFLMVPVQAQEFDLEGGYEVRSPAMVATDIAENNCCQIPSLSAIHVTRHDPSNRQIMQATIELSAAGLRVRERGADANMEMLQDFIGGNVWLIDRQRSITHLLPLDELPDEMALATPGAGSSFLGQEPCIDLRADYQGLGRWRGRQVKAFHCVDDDGQVLVIDFIDSKFGIVVYRRSDNGFVNELRQLKERDFAVGFFTPPTEYRAVSRGEFFFGAQALKHYAPPADEIDGEETVPSSNIGS